MVGGVVVVGLGFFSDDELRSCTEVRGEEEGVVSGFDGWLLGGGGTASFSFVCSKELMS